jgi:predicted SnoaL-like aldol condensation-catalyzing enzyme
MGSLAENKRVVLRHVQALNAGDFDELERLVHPDFFDHASTPREDNGRHGAVKRLYAAHAGYRLEPLDIIAEGDRVTVRARLDGNRSRQQIHIWRVLDGLIVEHWRSIAQEKEERDE